MHPYFNADISLGGEPTLNESGIFGSGAYDTRSQATIEMISPSDYPAGSTIIPVRFKVSDIEGLHQVLLLDTERESDGDAAGLTGLAACRGLNGEQDAVVEFEYDVSIPPYRRDPSDPEVHTLHVQVVDSDGEVTGRSFSLAEVSSYRIATLNHQNYIRSVSFSPDGTLLVTSEELIPTVRLWDAASREQVATLQLEDWSTALSFSPDGTLLAIADAAIEVSLWDVASRQRVDTLQPESWDFKLAFSPDGTLLAIGGSGENAVSLWDVASRQQVATLQADWVRSLSFSPDGTLLAIAESAGEEGHEVTLWDVASRQKVDTLQPRGLVWSLSFSPDGTLLATAGDLNQLWDVASRQEVALEPESWGGSLSFSPDGTLLAIGASGPVRLWDVASRQLVTTFVHTGSVADMSFSPDGTLLATGGSDGTVQLWDVSEWVGEQSITTVAHTLTKVSGDEQEGTVGAALAKPFVVSVLNQEGSAFAGAVVHFSVTAGGGTLSATTATTDANGRARSTLTLGSDPGTNTVEATVAGLESLTFTAIGQATTDSDGDDEQADDEQAMPQSLTKVSGEGQAGPAGTTLAEPFVVSVLDQNGAAFAGAVVTFSVTAGGGTLSATTATTNASGQARSTLTLGSDPGPNTVSATVAGLEPVAFTATATAIEQTPHSLTKVSGEGQAGPAGATLAEPFVVSVLDEDGAAIAGASVTFSVTAGGGTCRRPRPPPMPMAVPEAR